VLLASSGRPAAAAALARCGTVLRGTQWSACGAAEEPLGRLCIGDAAQVLEEESGVLGSGFEGRVQGLGIRRVDFINPGP
jgi:hypothetical protein